MATSSFTQNFKISKREARSFAKLMSEGGRKKKFGLPFKSNFKHVNGEVGLLLKEAFNK